MKKAIHAILLWAFLLACDPCRKDPSCDGDIKVSEIENKTNYNFPLTMLLDVGKDVYLNGEKIQFFDGLYQFPHAGFYQMTLKNGTDSSSLVFNLYDPERGKSEWGLKPWIPALPELTPLTSENVEAIYPVNIIPGTDIPIVIYIKENNTTKAINSEAVFSGNNKRFSVKNGVGSALIPSEIFSNSYCAVGTSQLIISANSLTSSAIELSGIVDKQIAIEPNSLVTINSNIEITQSGSLIIDEGTIVLLGEGVNIKNAGSLTISGSKEHPVMFTCSEKENFWGGFKSEGSMAAITASFTFFLHSGFHEGGEYSLGHAKRQALFHIKNSSLKLTSCYMLDNAGQIFYPENSSLQLNELLVQRAKTGGQLNGGSAILSNCIFADFPDESQNFRDNDNDCLYINGANVTCSNSVFMWAKDDGIDSGGSAGGELTFSNCLFESCFHEGAALSSADPAIKTHIFKNCIFRNNQQGLELGYSSTNHQVTADSCLFEKNYIGVRFGDNYDWPNLGFITVSNSLSLYNELDIWNMDHASWKPKLDHMQFINTRVSKKSGQYPQLELF